MTWTDEQIDEYVEDSFNLLESVQDKLEKEYGMGLLSDRILIKKKKSLLFQILQAQ